MNFYTINTSNFKSTTFTSSRVSMTLFYKALKKLSQDYHTIDDLVKFTLVFVESPVQIITPIDIAKQYNIDKKTILAVVPFNTEFTLQNGEEKTTIFGNQISLKSTETLQKPELGMPKEMTKQEMLALSWLKEERTGVSSKTMCFHIFPKIKDYYEANKNSTFKFEPDVPYDNSDLNRCIKFAKFVHLSPDQLEHVATINSKWKTIISQWNTLQELISSDSKEDKEQAYKIIQKSIFNNTPKM